MSYFGIRRKQLKEETSKVFCVNEEDVNYHDARFDVTATLNAYKYRDCDFEKYNTMEKIISNIDNIERNITYMKDILKQRNLDKISIRDMSNVDDLFNELCGNECYFDIEKQAQCINTSSSIIEDSIKEELKRMKKIEDLKMKHKIENILNCDDTTVIKAVVKEETNFSRLYRTVLFDMEIDSAYMLDYPHINVDLIELDTNEYLMLKYDNENAYIIKLDNNRYEEAYIMLEMNKVEFDICFPERLYEVRGFKTTSILPIKHFEATFKNEYEIDTNKDKGDKYNYEDDNEIPF